MRPAWRRLAVVALVLAAVPDRAHALRAQRFGAEADLDSGHKDQHPFFPGHQRQYEFLPIGAAVFLYGVTGCVALAAAALLVVCTCDAAAHWCHWARFYSCQRKVQCVHEVFRKRKGESFMCPYCVEFISSTSRSNPPVVFLCGHRFHMNCANKWFREHPTQSGRCPLCEGSAVSAQKLPQAPHVNLEASQPPEPAELVLAACRSKTRSEAGTGSTESSNDEALSFILGSLRRAFPDIITEDCVWRWRACRTEIWLSELQCPKYKSVLRKQPR